MSLKFSNFLREIKENNRELFDLWMAKNKQNPNKEVSGDNFEFAVYDKLTDFGYTVYSTEQEKSRYIVAGHDDLNAYLQEIKDAVNDEEAGIIKNTFIEKHPEYIDAVIYQPYGTHAYPDFLVLSETGVFPLECKSGKDGAMPKFNAAIPHESGTYLYASEKRECITFIRGNQLVPSEVREQLKRTTALVSDFLSSYSQNPWIKNPYGYKLSFRKDYLNEKINEDTLLTLFSDKREDTEKEAIASIEEVENGKFYEGEINVSLFNEEGKLTPESFMNFLSGRGFINLYFDEQTNLIYFSFPCHNYSLWNEVPPIKFSDNVFEMLDNLSEFYDNFNRDDFMVEMSEDFPDGSKLLNRRNIFVAYEDIKKSYLDMKNTFENLVYALEFAKYGFQNIKIDNYGMINFDIPLAGKKKLHFESTLDDVYDDISYLGTPYGENDMRDRMKTECKMSDQKAEIEAARVSSNLRNIESAEQDIER